MTLAELGRYTVLVVCLLAISVGVVQATPVSPDAADRTPDLGAPDVAVPADVTGSPGVTASIDGDERDEGRETGASVLPEWWGLGGEASEAPYIGLVELGVTLLVVGVGGYSAGKRLGLVPTSARRRLLQAHEWTVLVGTALTVPHFVFAGEWEGLGLAVGVLLAVEVASGVYGRHLHRHVVRLGRGAETSAHLARVVDVSNSVLFRRWRRVHVSLTVLTAVVLVLHVLTAVGE